VIRGGIICDPEGTLVAHYAWGLGNVSNNIVEFYALWEGIRFTKAMGIQKLTIFGDSMLVIRAIIKRNIIGNNVFIGIISHSLSLLVEFEVYNVFHIKRELNFEVDRWAKVGSNLEEGEILINGTKGRFPIP
jgi:ribonuclease HI